MDNNRTIVRIAGQEFKLTGDESQQYMDSLADMVNARVDAVKRTYPMLSTGNCVLLAALNMADELTKLRSDYEARGYSDNMWLADTALAAQLGLITKQPDGDYTINRELQTEFSKLKPHQRKAITAIYEAFGYDTFSSEMFVATLNYSVSYTYASLHKLTLLRILEQKITDEGCQYQLLVNPEDHPECFIEAA